MAKFNLFGINFGSDNIGQPDPTTTKTLNVDVKKTPSGAKVVERVMKTQLTRSRANIKKWVDAVAIAESTTSPNRTELMRVFQELDRDAHLKSIMTQRLNAVISTPFYIMRNDEIDDESTKVFQKTWFTDFVKYAVDSIFYGHSLIQLGDIMDGEFDSVSIVPRQYVQPEVGKIRTQMGAQPSVDYTSGAFANWVVPVGRPDDLGVMNNAVPLLIYKKDVLSAWSEYADMFGSPVRIGRTDIENEAKKTNMDDMLQNMGSMAWGTFDRDDMLEYVETSKADAFNVFEQMVEVANKELAKLFLGQTGTTDEKSFVGSAEVHERVANTYSQVDRKFIESVVNKQLIPICVKHGLVPDGSVFKYDFTETLSLLQKADIVQKLGQFYEFDAEWVSKQFGIPVTGVKSSIPTPGDAENFSTSQRVLQNTIELYDNANHKH